LYRHDIRGSEGTMRASVVAAIVMCSVVARADDPSLLSSVTLTGTDARPAQLRRYAGKPAVVFYEDRGSIETNQALKDALVEQGRQHGLLSAVSVIAIANISAYNFPPAREIATAFIRRAERQAGIPILLDLSGALQAPPWTLPDDASTVLLLDAGGRVVWRHSGKVPAAESGRMLDQLRQLVATG
jgi:hypothetical protein